MVEVDVPVWWNWTCLCGEGGRVCIVKLDVSEVELDMSCVVEVDVNV